MGKLRAEIASIIAFALLLAVICEGTGFQHGWCQTSSVTITGQYGSFLQLSAGTPSQTGGKSVSISNQSTGAIATGAGPDVQDFAGSVDFGDLAKGDGNLIVSGVGLRMRSNTHCQLVTSLSSFQASNLQYHGQNVVTANGGTFIKVWSGPITATGPNSLNPSQTIVNSALMTGMPLSALSRGAASASSTAVCAMPAASMGGDGGSADNALEVPIYVAVPTGFDLGPAPGTAIGTFSFVLQFGLFPGP